MKHCKTCRWWRERTFSKSVADSGYCDAIDVDGEWALVSEEVPAEMEVTNTSTHAKLITHSTFGCTMHEDRGAS